MSLQGNKRISKREKGEARKVADLFFSCIENTQTGLISCFLEDVNHMNKDAFPQLLSASCLQLADSHWTGHGTEQPEAMLVDEGYENKTGGGPGRGIR